MCKQTVTKCHTLPAIAIQYIHLVCFFGYYLKMIFKYVFVFICYWIILIYIDIKIIKNIHIRQIKNLIYIFFLVQMLFSKDVYIT